MEQLEFPIETSTRHAVYIRLTEREYRRVQKMAQAHHLSLPEFFRKIVLSKEGLERPLFSMDFAKVFEVELRRQGNNVNQITKQLNSGLMNRWSQAINSLVRAYVDLRHILTLNRANSLKN